MRLAALAATASIAVLAFGATACKSSSHASAPAAATNAPATETQADATQSPSTGASTAASTASSSASPSASASAAASAPAAAAGGEINACSLLTGAQASSLTGRSYGTGTASTIAPGQDQCDYPYSGAGIDLTVIVYQPSSGVSWNVMTSVLSGVGTVQQVAGVGDKAMFAGIELDVATGKWLVSVQGADALNADTGSIAVAKEIVGALASK